MPSRQKKHWLLLGILLSLCLFSYVFFINAEWTLSFSNLSQYSIKAKFSQLTFSPASGSFGGGIFWLPATTYNQDVTISFASTSGTRKCKKQLRGLYFNHMRGPRLLPLDQETLDILKAQYPVYNSMNINGGFYTFCNGLEKDSIFGYIQYLSGTTSQSYMVAGVKLDYANNNYFAEFSDSFQNINNSTPLGYFWDSIGGIAFVGGEITGNQELLSFLNQGGAINKAFKINNGVIDIFGNNGWGFNNGSGVALNAMWNILVQGNSILSKAVNLFSRKDILSNAESRTILLSSSEINSSTIINLAKKNAETLCRSAGYSSTEGNKLINDSTSNKKVLCLKDQGTVSLNVNSDTYKDKTIILQNTNLTIDGSMDNNSAPLDLFIDRGNLYLNMQGNHSITPFSIQGFPSTSSNELQRGIFLKGNIIINGLLIGEDNHGPTTIEDKLHIQGKFVSLNTLGGTISQSRVTQVNDILGTDNFDNFIRLEDVFNWQCSNSNINGNLSVCGTGDDENITTIPFVILDGNLPSKIIK